MAKSDTIGQQANTMINGQPLVRITNVTGKGKGIVATRNMKRGTRIFSEPPLLQIPILARSEQVIESKIRQELDYMDSDRVSKLEALAAGSGPEALATRLSLILQRYYHHTDHELGGLFAQASYLNHSCFPNSILSWNPDTQLMNAHALVDIQEGEEITIYYLKSFSTWEIRQRILASLWCFTCTCAFCVASDKESSLLKSKFRFLQMAFLLAEEKSFFKDHPTKAIVILREALAIGHELRQNVIKLWFYTAALFLTHSDLARARCAFAILLDEIAVHHGQDSPKYHHRDKQMNDMSRLHRYYQESSRWKSTYREIPWGTMKDYSPEFYTWFWQPEEINPLDHEVVQTYALSPSLDLDALKPNVRTGVESLIQFYHANFGPSARPPSALTWYADRE